jgi:hypothetical protein
MQREEEARYEQNGGKCADVVEDVEAIAQRAEATSGFIGKNRNRGDPKVI